jgi:hypothetical protein
MLLQFTFENVLSFRDETVLSLLAAPGVEHAPGQVIEVPGLPRPVLRVAALYGANASGKSNLVKAMAMARSLVLDGTRPDKPIAVVPFKLDPEAYDKPCRFEFELWADGYRWSYGFACTTERVVAEWLYCDAGEGERNVFDRALDHDRLSIVVGTGLALDEERRRFWGFVADGTRDNQLFLAEARERNVKELEAPLRALLEDLVVVAAGEEARDLVDRLEQRAGLLAFASELLRKSGTGVSQIGIALGASVRVGDQVAQRMTEGEWLRSLTRKRRIVFLHPGAVDSTEEFVMEESEESDGTRRLVGLSPPLFSLVDSPAAVVIDELDRSLHTLLSRNLIEHFLAAEPSRSGQLVFTTHDTNLLDLELLSCDSIWFVEKNRAGGSSIYSLAEFKPEQLEQLGNRVESGYLHGRFGGTPFLSNPRISGWTKKGAP